MAKALKNTNPIFKVFLSHNSKDKTQVEYFAQMLKKEKGIDPWLDKWNLIPGDPWQEVIEKALAECNSCAVFIGGSGISPWQHEEMRDAISSRVSQKEKPFRVIPVLLPGAKREERGKMPSFLTRSTWVVFEDSLDDKEAMHRLICGIKGIPPGAGEKAPLQKGNPYQGMHYFDVKNAPLFFGREAMTDWLIDKLRKKQGNNSENRFLGIVGASGSGKSSIARAGLLASLKKGDLPNSEQWKQIICFPGEDPLENLAETLVKSGLIEKKVGCVNDFISNAQGEEKTLHRIVKINCNEGEKILLLIDQFEEVFTLCKKEVLRKAFIDNLIYASTISAGKLITILTMRSDFYGKCAAYEKLSALMSDHPFLVGKMTETELENAIIQPAKLYGSNFESGLVDKLLEELQASSEGLPLLQDTLQELWERKEGATLTHSALADIGGLGGALDKRANEVYKNFSPKNQALCKRIFLRLIQPGEGTEDTKRRVSLAELITSGDREDIEALVLELSKPNVRLLSAKGNKEDSDNVEVEVIHEALIRNWGLLKSWIDQERESLILHRRLTRDADDWEANKYNADYLYTGFRLVQANELKKSKNDELNKLERLFVDTSFAQERNRKRTRNLIIFAFTLLAILAFAFINSERKKAKTEANISDAMRLVGLTDREIDSNNYRLAYRFLQESYNKAYDQIPEVINKSFINIFFNQIKNQGVVNTWILETQGCDQYVEFSPKDNLVFFKSEWDPEYPNNEVILVDLKRGPLEYFWHTYLATFSPDGQMILTCSNDNIVKLWDINNGKVLTTIDKYMGRIDVVEFSPDGNQILTRSGSIVKSWDLKGNLLANLHSQENDDLESAEFLFNGNQILTRSGSTVESWDLIRKSLVDVGDFEFFAPDSGFVISKEGIYDCKIKIWDLNYPYIAGFEKQVEGVLFTEFSPNSDMFITSGSLYNNNDTVKLWDLKGNLLANLAIQEDDYFSDDGSVEFSLDGKTILCTATHKIYKWDLNGNLLSSLHTLENGISAKYSPDGKMILIWGRKGARLRNLDLELLSYLDKDTINLIRFADFSPDGQLIFTCSSGYGLKLWDLKGRLLTTINKKYDYDFNSAEVSPNGQLILTNNGDGDGEVELWDLNGKLIVNISNTFSGTYSAKFSPNGSYIVIRARYIYSLNSGSAFKDQILLLDLKGNLIAETVQHVDKSEEWISRFLDFSSDGQYIISSSPDGYAVNIWNLKLELLVNFDKHVRDAKISPDGKYVLSVSGDNIVKLWPTPKKIQEVLESFSIQGFSEEEKLKYSIK